VRQLRLASALKEQLQDIVKLIEALGTVSVSCLVLLFAGVHLYVPFTLSRSQGKKFWGDVVDDSHSKMFLGTPAAQDWPR